MTRGRRLGLALGVLVFSITVAAFLPALQGQFLNWDDGLLFTKNLDYRGLGPAQLRLDLPRAGSLDGGSAVAPSGAAARRHGTGSRSRTPPRSTRTRLGS